LVPVTLEPLMPVSPVPTPTTVNFTVTPGIGMFAWSVTVAVTQTVEPTGSVCAGGLTTTFVATEMLAVVPSREK